MTITAILISEEGIQHRLDESLTIGREDDNTVVLNNDRVSRHHATLALREEQVILEDLNSSNGTRRNGASISGAVILEDGDVVEFGPFAFSLELRDDSVSDGSATVLDQATTPEARGSRHGKFRAGNGADKETPLPGSWVEQDNLESTQFFHNPSSLKATPVERHGDLPQFLLLDAMGSVKAVFELELGGSEDDHVWELGRQESCDVRIEDPTVSLRHAQLVHKDGRWRIVNLVSSNGIIVNGEKRLSVYLSDGDVVQLGSSQLAFFGDASRSGGKTGRIAAGSRNTAKGGSTSSKRTLWITVTVALVVAAAGAALFLK